MVSSGEAVTHGRLLAAALTLVTWGMGIVGIYLIAQMSVWHVLPGILLTYGALIGQTVAGRIAAR